MNDNFMKFRRTGEIKYYLKYKEDMKYKGVKSTNGNNKGKGDSTRVN